MSGVTAMAACTAGTAVGLPTMAGLDGAAMVFATRAGSETGESLLLSAASVGTEGFLFITTGADEGAGECMPTMAGCDATAFVPGSTGTAGAMRAVFLPSSLRSLGDFAGEAREDAPETAAAAEFSLVIDFS